MTYRRVWKNRRLNRRAAYRLAMVMWFVTPIPLVILISQTSISDVVKALMCLSLGWASFVAAVHTFEIYRNKLDKENP